MKSSALIFFAILFQFISLETFSQDSLHYVTSFYGISGDGLAQSYCAGDMNGDGLSDFIIRYVKHAELYYGSKDMKNLKPAHVFYCADCAPIGDVNGDGFSDIMTTEKDTANPNYPYTSNIFRIYFGGHELDTVPKFFYKPPYYIRMLYTLGYNIGDINADGYGDFVIGSPYNWSWGTGQVYVFLGGKTLATTPALKLELPEDSLKHMDFYFGEEIVGVGDQNSDKYDDFLVSGSIIGAGDSGRAYLYYGGDTLSDKPGKIITSPLRVRGFGRSIRNAGDLNKDGQTDFIVTDYGYNNIYFGEDSVVSFVPAGSNDDIASGGDINGDGYSDFVVGFGEYLNKDGVMVGKASGYYGGSPFDTTVSFSMEGTKKWLFYANTLSIIGDINGDGCDEVLIHEPGWPEYELYKSAGRAMLYSYKKQTDAVEEKSVSPVEFNLLKNYPNPFNPSTQISFQVPEGSKVTLKVFDMLGKEVATLVDEYKSAGAHKVQFNASNLPSGIYIYKLRAGEHASMRKMMLLK